MSPMQAPYCLPKSNYKNRRMTGNQRDIRWLPGCIFQTPYISASIDTINQRVNATLGEHLDGRPKEVGVLV